MPHSSLKSFLASLLILSSTSWSLAGGLQLQIERVIRGAGLRETKVSVYVADADTGERLAAVNPIEPMIPASNMKLIITAAALHLLGPDFLFRTELRLLMPEDWREREGLVMADPDFRPRDGPILLVQGDGDPAFGDQTLLNRHNLDVEQLLNAWVEQVRATGLSSVQRLIVDDRAFDRNFIHPTWPADQLNMWYCAEVAGLNVNDNCLDVYVEPTLPRQSPLITIRPAVPFLRPMNRAATGNSDTFWISRKPGTNELTFWGQVKSRSEPFYVTFHDPPLFFARLLAHRLEAAGIRVDAIGRPDWDDALPQGRVLHTVQTTLPLVISRCNKDSQNLFAEALLKRIGRQYTGAPGSWENGAAAIRAFLNHLIGPRSASVVVVDGSGLSRDNRVTAAVLVEILKKMHQDPQRKMLFRESLSVGGVDGTLRKRFKRGLSSRVFGKSGYIDGVSTLSGYLVMPTTVPADGGPATAGEDTVVFSFLFNGIKPPVYLYQIKSLQNELIKLIDKEMQTRAERALRRGG